MAHEEARHQSGDEEGTHVSSLEQDAGLAELRAHVPAAIRDVSFPSAARGYERRAVDAYVNEVNRLIAELEVGSSPQAAVRHALERVGEQTKGLLQQARETAEEITAGAHEDAEAEVSRARAEAEEITAGARTAEAAADEIVTKARSEAKDTLAGARAEAAEIVSRARAEAQEVLARAQAEVAERLQRLDDEIADARSQAETRMQELHAETEAVWNERHELLDEIHAMGTRLLEVASTAAAGGSRAGGSGEGAPTSADADSE